MRGSSNLLLSLDHARYIACAVDTEILQTNTPELFAEAISRAAATLRRGELVAVPTETVYGLAANAMDAESVGKIFKAKQRPQKNPIIVHVASESMARDCVVEWPESASLLGQAFWPGPLTMVLPKADCISANVTAGGDTVGVRWAKHSFMQALIESCRFPLAVPSANLSNHLSPTTAAHVKSQLKGRLPLIIDGGAANVGIESTVADLTGVARVLRPGMISAEAISAVLSEAKVLGLGGNDGPLKSPGQMPRHYAPNARLLVLTWKDEADLESQIAYSRTPHDRVCVIAHTSIVGGTRFGRVSVIPKDPEAYARELYSELHRCDEEGAELIVVEAVPKEDKWEAISDRLARAGA